MGPLWRVRMLGGLRAESDDLVVDRFRTRRVGLLLAYLAYHDDRNHSRDELADLLWPDLDPERARRNLRQALSSLRHHLEPPPTPAGAALDARQSGVRLNPTAGTSDVGRFRRALREGKAAEAVKAYGGELLPGFYEDWVQTERLRLEDEYVAALETCLRMAEADGRLEDAIGYARQALAKDTLREDLHARLIRLTLAVGRPASAAAHLAEWEARSEAELGFLPDPELRREVEAARLTPKSDVSSLTPTSRRVTAPEVTRPPVVRLPIALTRFFGRERERETAVDALGGGETRLLTLTGPAGTGKTRLATEVGRILGERHGWNVWFVPLADISEGEGLLDATLAAMRMERRDGTPLETLAERLSEGDNLLVLDNLEHIVEAAAPQVAAIVASVPNVALLVTSRQSLRIEGEREVDLGTLPLPPETEEVALADLAGLPSVGLFVDRARASLPDFALTSRNAAAIGAICRRLDGLPLALEIAAGLVGAFSPAQLLQNLEGRLELLRSRRRDLSPRHQSLRAAIDYSYGLLDPALQAFFVRLSVFRGGFTVESAGEVCLVAQARRGEWLRAILDLQERSLLRAEETTREEAPARFRLLESYREYAAELLDADEKAVLRHRHADFFRRHPATPEDRDNRVAAVRFFHDAGLVGECLELLLSFDGFSAVAEDVVRALARSPEFEGFLSIEKTRILRLMADVHVHHSDFEEALRACRRACEIAEAAGLNDERATGRRKLSLVLAYLGRRQESIALSEENLREAQQGGDLLAISYAYTNIGTSQWSLGHFEAARQAHEGAYAASVELRGGSPYWAILYNLSLTNLDLGRLDEGLEQASEGLRLAQAADETFGVSMCLASVSRYHRYRGNLPAALSTSYESLIRRRGVGFLYWTFQAIFAHAVVLQAMGLATEATTLVAAARSVERVNGREFGVAVAELREALGPVAFERAWADGLAMGLDAAYRLAASFR